MILRAIVAFILLVVASVAVERLLFFSGYGFSLLENATMLLAIIVLILLNKIFELKKENSRLKNEVKSANVEYIEEVENLKIYYNEIIEQKKQDRETFDRMMKALPQTGSLAFLRTGSYLITLFDPDKELSDFQDLEKKYTQGALLFYFFDEELEQAKNILIKDLLKAFIKIKSCLIKKNKEDKEYYFNLDLKPSNDKYKDVVEEVSVFVGDFLEKYDSFRKIARKNIGCS